MMLESDDGYEESDDGDGEVVFNNIAHYNDADAEEEEEEDYDEDDDDSMYGSSLSFLSL